MTAAATLSALRRAGVEGRYRVVVRGNAVALVGRVESQYHRALAGHVAAALPGVGLVDNELTVELPPQLRDSSHRAARGAALARAVRRQIEAAGGIDDDDLLVLVDGQEVTLGGSLHSRDDLRRAVLAARAAGATVVRSRVTTLQ